MSKNKPLSFADFTVDDSGSSVSDNLELDEDKDLEQDEELEDEVEEDKEDKKKVKSKTDLKKSKKETPKDEDEDQDEDEDEEDKPDTKKEVKKSLDKKKVEVPEDETEEGDEESDPEEAQRFFEAVEKLTGQTVDVDYGDVSPLSPQGVALRDKAIKQQALDAFLEEIEGKFPVAFQALTHAYNGGDITELFSKTTGRDYSKLELKDGDDPLAKEILKEYYKSRGVKNEAKIAKMIEADEDSEGGLVREAQTALKELQEEQDAERQEILETQKQKAAEQKKKDQILVTAVDEVLETRKLGSFKITDRQEASDFKKFVMQSLRRSNDGNYEFVTPLATANLEKQLQAHYFQFKGGDLTKIIQQKAATENAKKMSLKFQSEQSKIKKNTQEEKKASPSLRDFTR